LGLGIRLIMLRRGGATDAVEALANDNRAGVPRVPRARCPRQCPANDIPDRCAVRVRSSNVPELRGSLVHRVTLESLAPLTSGNRELVCLGGARGCPPEDVGGIHGHHAVAAWLRAGAPANNVPEPFEDADHAYGWLPVGYDPDAFDTAEATTAMRMWARGEHLP